MKPTQELRNMGQSFWLDNITRSLLMSGTLRHYRDDFSIIGLTSNPSSFDHAIELAATRVFLGEVLTRSDALASTIGVKVKGLGFGWGNGVFTRENREELT